MTISTHRPRVLILKYQTCFTRAMVIFYNFFQLCRNEIIITIGSHTLGRCAYAHRTNRVIFSTSYVPRTSDFHRQHAHICLPLYINHRFKIIKEKNSKSLTRYSNMRGPDAKFCVQII